MGIKRGLAYVIGSSLHSRKGSQNPMVGSVQFYFAESFDLVIDSLVLGHQEGCMK
jgi:hypothetical protein